MNRAVLAAFAFLGATASTTIHAQQPRPKAADNQSFKPFQPKRQIVTPVRCHMDQCSWAKWLSVEVLGAKDGELSINLILLGGSSPMNNTKRSGVIWNKTPHVVRALCSYSRPTVSTGDQNVVLPLNPDNAVPGVLESDENFYFAACHSDLKVSSDRPAKYSYNIEDTQVTEAIGCDGSVRGRLTI